MIKMSHAYIRKPLVTIIILNIVLTIFVFGVNTSSAAELPLNEYSNTQQCSANASGEVVEVDRETSTTLLAAALDSVEFKLFEQKLEYENGRITHRENQLKLETTEQYLRHFEGLCLHHNP